MDQKIRDYHAAFVKEALFGFGKPKQTYDSTGEKYKSDAERASDVGHLTQQHQDQYTAEAAQSAQAAQQNTAGDISRTNEKYNGMLQNTQDKVDMERFPNSGNTYNKPNDNKFGSIKEYHAAFIKDAYSKKA